ncbi:uncharacterized protein [Nothobranchius furzeri]|uniref:uncharacterized protein isoform X2 n=1 Tax=Nothobranchius furzeri TaxID=105023 RepID=UPI0024047BEC|nr:uncharacterized protein LOC107392565 isoform X2 [Nothobranchius furzeri]
MSHKVQNHRWECCASSNNQKFCIPLPPRRLETNMSRWKTVFSRLSPPEPGHQKPQSAYSRKVTCDQKDDLPPPSQFVNFQVKLVNDCERKRKYDDSTPRSSSFKKPCTGSALSPDLGCFIDHSSPLARSNSASPVTFSRSPLKNKQVSSSQPDSEIYKDPSDEVKAVQLSPGSEEHLINISRTFDAEVDDILCLNPLKKDGQEETCTGAKTGQRAVEEDRGYNSDCSPNGKEGECSPEPRSPENSSIPNEDVLEIRAPAVSFLEGEVEDLIIGLPMFESSVCQPCSMDEQGSLLPEVHKEPLLDVQAPNPENSAVESSYDVTLPLQVQVRSQVVVPHQDVKCTSIPRPKIYEDELEWERLKRQYVFSVTSHMTENQATSQGFVSELLTLMTHVADQTGSNGSQWQHPSDLTCRNYQKRFGSERSAVTLGEWRVKNSPHYKRFGKNNSY